MLWVMGKAARQGGRVKAGLGGGGGGGGLTAGLGGGGEG